MAAEAASVSEQPVNALWNAAGCGDAETAERLTAAGRSAASGGVDWRNPQEMSRTALMDAMLTPLDALPGAGALTTLLVTAGADVKLQSDEGWTALHFAAGAGHIEAVEALLASGRCELGLADKEAGRTPLDVATETAKTKAASATEKEAQLAVDADRVQVEQREIDLILVPATRAVEAATSAVASLRPSDIAELKASRKPLVALRLTCEAICALRGNVKPDWKAAKIMMGDAREFLSALEAFDKESVGEQAISAAKKYQEQLASECNVSGPAQVQKIGLGARGLLQWVFAIVDYSDAYKPIAPRCAALQEATNMLAAGHTEVAQMQRVERGCLRTVRRLERALKGPLLDDRCNEKQAFVDRGDGGFSTTLRKVAATSGESGDAGVFVDSGAVVFNGEEVTVLEHQPEFCRIRKEDGEEGFLCTAYLSSHRSVFPS